MRTIKNVILSLTLLVAGCTVVPATVMSGSAFAATGDAKDRICKGINNGGGCTTGEEFGDIMVNIVNIILYIVGAVAVLMLVIGGLRYVLSGGDSSQTKSAKDTILYAIIGIVIAFAAYAIVNFVVANLV